MTTVRLFGTVKHTQSDLPRANAQIIFALDRGSYTSENSYFREPIVVSTDAQGSFSVYLWANGEGLRETKWTARFPDGDGFNFVLMPNQTEVNISDLRQDSDWIDDGSITLSDSRIGDRTINQSLANPANTGNLTQLFSWLGGRIKAITGEENWINEPAIDLTQIKAFIDNSSGANNPETFSTVVVPNSIALQVRKVYVCTGLALQTLTLPVSADVGDLIYISGQGSGLFRIAQNVGQQVRFGDRVTSLGLAGRVDSLSQGDSLSLLCTASNFWSVISSSGNFEVA